MSEKVTNELMYEVLKSLQADMSDLKHGQSEIRESVISLREDVNSSRKDTLRV